MDAGINQVKSADHATSNVHKKRYLCLTILGHRRPGMTEEEMRYHMTQVSAPMTKGLMVKYGIKRWTQIHNTAETRALTTYLFDRQMPNVAEYDCFSQCVFEDLDGYKRMKEDPWYKEHLVGDHEKFADTKKTKITIGWIEEWVKDGKVCDGLEFPETSAWISGERLIQACMYLAVIGGAFWTFRASARR